MARIVFMGTPDYARRILEAIQSAQDDFLVVTKPDMPVGRHRQLTPSPVAEWAAMRGLPVLKPMRLKDARDVWESFQPDWILTAAFGRILPSWALGLPRYGAYNLHASLLPRWRGPNPIAWAIRSGDPVTGVTLMRMEEGVDTGPIVSQVRMEIEPHETTGDLTMRLADAAAHLWLEARAPGVCCLPERPQPTEGAIHAPKFDSLESRLDWALPAERVDAWVRSMTPEPGAYTMLGSDRIKILQASVSRMTAGDRPGLARLAGSDWLVAAGDNRSLRVSVIQPAGRRPMAPVDFARGRRGETEWLLT